MFIIRRSKRELIEMIHMWAALESMSARLATLHAPDADIGKLRHLFDAAELGLEFSAFDAAEETARAFAPSLAELPAPDAAVEVYLAREVKFDPDVWIVEIEDREGRAFVDEAIV
jgi:DNA-binding GntR family transcriptional regulator